MNFNRIEKETYYNDCYYNQYNKYNYIITSVDRTYVISVTHSCFSNSYVKRASSTIVINYN